MNEGITLGGIRFEPINEGMSEEGMEENQGKKFTLAITKNSDRYFLTRLDSNHYVAISEETNIVSKIDETLAKEMFRAVGSATDIENKKCNELLNSSNI